MVLLFGAAFRAAQLDGGALQVKRRGWRVHSVVWLDARRRLVSFTAVGSGVIDQLDVFWSTRICIAPA